KRGAKALSEPVFATPPSVPFFHFIRAYNRRFVQIARSRRINNRWGRLNDRHRFLFPGYTFAPTSALPITKALLSWAGLELREGWRSWFGIPGEKRPVVKNTRGDGQQQEPRPLVATPANAQSRHA